MSTVLLLQEKHLQQFGMQDSNKPVSSSTDLHPAAPVPTH